MKTPPLRAAPVARLVSLAVIDYTTARLSPRTVLKKRTSGLVLDATTGGAALQPLTVATGLDDVAVTLQYRLYEDSEDSEVSTIVICGGGFAACCCARLLTRAGFRPASEKAGRPRLPAIMLSETTQKLLVDIFERSDLFEGLHRIRKRVVAWGGGRKPETLPHSAVVAAEQVLLDRIHSDLTCDDSLEPGEARWTVVTSRLDSAAFTEHGFGSRMATASAIKLKASVEADACWIESLASGWLFLLPISVDSGWLLSVGDTCESLMDGSRLVADQIAEVHEAAGRFPSYPRIVEPLAGPGWLSCGSAALGFDPLCGDGTGHAAREAILGSAVIRAACDGADVDAVTAHYQTRLLAGFTRHLEVCREFYEAARSGPWWDRQIDEINHGLEWTSQRLQIAPRSRYRLNGFSLESIDRP